MWYAQAMSIGWVMFWKALILAVWSSYKDFRQDRKDKGFSPSLVLYCKERWDRRCAEQPRLLTDQRSRVLDDTGA